LRDMTMFEMNEQNKHCPVSVTEQIIDGKRYIVKSHFIGEKDIDIVIHNIAFTRAMSETLAPQAA
jgi:hypothetical protein